MHRNTRHSMMAALLLTLGACGAGEGEQVGVLLAKLTVALGGEVDPSVVAPHAGLIWVPYAEDIEVPLLLTESMPLSTSLEQMRLSVFQGPPPGAILQKNGAQIALGMIVAFDDRDGDGTFAVRPEGIVAPDLFFGVNLTELLIFLEVPHGAELGDLFVNPEAFEPGLSRARIDFCTGKLEFLPMAAPIVLELFEPTANYGFLFQEPDCEPDDAL